MNINRILASVFTILCLVACEKINESVRWSEPEPLEMKKNVLVEDFTGQNCPNCPTAASLLSELKNSSLGSHIIVVSIHGGNMSYNEKIKGINGLANEIGEEYNRMWKIGVWPTGMIDRTDGNNNLGQTALYTQWTSGIVNQGVKDLVVDLDVTSNYDSNTRHLDVRVVPVRGNVADGMRITVWLTESAITAPQKMGDNRENASYVHNHVLRACLNDNPTGDDVSRQDYSYDIPEQYGRNTNTVKPENMSIVAFITDASGEVMQVVEKKIKN